MAAMRVKSAFFGKAKAELECVGTLALISGLKCHAPAVLPWLPMR